MEVKGRAVGVTELDGPRRVRGTPVDERPQHDPPVEEVTEIATVHAQTP